MFPADCLPSNYVEARAQKERELAQQAATEKKPTLLAQPIPKRPSAPRTLSSALFSFFPSAVSSASTSPSATPMPSPGLHQSSKMHWFAPLPKPSEQDIAVSIPSGISIT